MSIQVMMQMLGQGFLVSLQLFVLTLLGSIPLGIPVAFMRMSKIAPLRWIARIYISVMRGTPLMLQMFAIYFAPYYVFGISLTPDSKWTACVVAFIINYAGYFAEIYRSGLQSIPRGQYEAAEVLGYSRVQTFLYIVMPQVAKRTLPAMGNEIITLVKDTSLAFAIGVGEMFSTAKALVASQVSMVPFAIAALIYWVFNFVVEMLLGAAEKKLDYQFVEENPWEEALAPGTGNPLGKVPRLVMDGTEAMFDSRVIVEYLDTLSPVGKLIPGTGRERAEVKTWEALADGVMDAGILARLEATWVHRKDSERSQAWIDRQLLKVNDGLKSMSQGLGDKPYCSGIHLSLSDIAVGCALGWLEFRFPEIAWRNEYPNLGKLLDKLMQRPSFADTKPG